jgi:hypothetical protein
MITNVSRHGGRSGCSRSMAAPAAVARAFWLFLDAAVPVSAASLLKFASRARTLCAAVGLGLLPGGAPSPTRGRGVGGCPSGDQL